MPLAVLADANTSEVDAVDDSGSFPLLVSGDLPWAEPLNVLASQLAVLADGNTSEVDAVDKAVDKLAALLEAATAQDVGDDKAAARAAAREVEKRTEELAALLDRLPDAVNGVFHAALHLRAVKLGSFAVGHAELGITSSSVCCSPTDYRVDQNKKQNKQNESVHGTLP
nr:uncharacterized protein LOC127328747 [Lolium perenne]